MVGTRFVQQGIEKFEAAHPDTLIAINVTRHPYSWAGDDRNFKPYKITYKEHLGDNAELYKEMAEDKKNPKRVPMDVLGRVAEIEFNTGPESGLMMKYHPINAQRLILWAAEKNKQENMAGEISKLHFEQVKTCADDENLLEAVKNAGLDVDEAVKYLATDRDVEEVWESYGRMLHGFGIQGIPLFSFTTGISPFTDPRFRQGVGPQPLIVQGSASPDMFLRVFEGLHTNKTAQEVFGGQGMFTGEELYRADEELKKKKDAQQARL